MARVMTSVEDYLTIKIYKLFVTKVSTLFLQGSKVEPGAGE